jgi:hypothetical protein
VVSGLSLNAPSRGGFTLEASTPILTHRGLLSSRDLERDLLGAVKGLLGVYIVPDIRKKHAATVSTPREAMRIQRRSQPGSGRGARVLQIQLAAARAKRMGPQ